MRFPLLLATSNNPGGLQLNEKEGGRRGGKEEGTKKTTRHMETLPREKLEQDDEEEREEVGVDANEEKENF